jgi:hypothetical protein
MFADGEPTHVPAPFRNLPFGRYDRDQSKRTHLPEWQGGKRHGDLLSGRLSSQRRHNPAATNDYARGLTFDAMPIDQGKTSTCVVRRDPCSAARFRWKKCAPVCKIDDLRRKRGRARPLLVAIHRYVKSI